MLSVVGYTKWGDTTKGHIRLQENPDWIDDAVERQCIQRSTFCQNKASIVPGINVVTGLYKIFVGVLGLETRNQWVLSYIHPEDFCKYRVMMILTGLAELTLVGGWVLHGGATLYYYSQPKGTLQS